MRIPETIQERRKLLKQELNQYIGISFYCKALDCKVSVTEKSVTETAYQAAISKQATKLALHLPEVIREASVLELHLPAKVGRQQKNMKFVEIANLVSSITRVGIAKLTVGFTLEGNAIHYAITDFECIK